ncbi:MAG: hypothetical protein V3V75_03850 [Thermoguttaceae bacterium]
MGNTIDAGSLSGRGIDGNAAGEHSGSLADALKAVAILSDAFGIKAHSPIPHFDANAVSFQG